MSPFINDGTIADFLEKLREAALPAELLLFADIPNLSVIEGSAENQHYDTLLIFDDLMSEAFKSKTVQDVFSRTCHHRRMTAILVLQNFFCPGPLAKNITRQASQYIVFRTRSDLTSLRSLSKLACGNSDFLQKVFAFIETETPSVRYESRSIVAAETLSSPMFFFKKIPNVFAFQICSGGR